MWSFSILTSSLEDLQGRLMCYARSILYGLFLPKRECFTHSTGTLQNLQTSQCSAFQNFKLWSVSTLQCSRHGEQWHYHSILYEIMFIVCNDECMSGVHWNTNLADSAGCWILRAGVMWVPNSFFIFFSFEIPCDEILIYILVISFQYDSYTPCIVAMFLVMLWSCYAFICLSYCACD